MQCYIQAVCEASVLLVSHPKRGQHLKLLVTLTACAKHAFPWRSLVVGSQQTGLLRMCYPVLAGDNGARSAGGRHAPTELPAAEIRALLADRAPLMDMQVG